MATSRGTNIDELFDEKQLYPVEQSKTTMVRDRGETLSIEEGEPFDSTFVEKGML